MLRTQKGAEVVQRPQWLPSGPQNIQFDPVCGRPPARFTPGTDLELWIKCFDLYGRRIGVPKKQWTVKILPLLDNAPFRVIDQPGLVESADYDAVIAQLKRQYSPEMSSNGSSGYRTVPRNPEKALSSTLGVFACWQTKPTRLGARNSAKMPSEVSSRVC